MRTPLRGKALPDLSLFEIAAPLPRHYVGVCARKTLSLAPALGVMVLVDVLFGSHGAFAQPAPVRIAYAAGQGCPTGAEFASSVAARGRTVVAVDDDAPWAMRVSIAAEATGGYHGTLRMGASGEGAREVRGSTCREVVDALAVVTVSSLGPEEPSANQQATLTAPATAPTPPQALTDPPPPPAPTVAPASRPQTGNIAAAPREVTVGPGTLRFDHDIAMSVFGGVTTGIVPGVVLPRFDFEAARTNLVTSPEGNRYRVVPTVRLHMTFFPYGDPYRSSYGTTTASGFGVGADICSPLYYDRTGLSVLLCFELMGGYFGLQTTDPKGVSGPIKLAGYSTGGLGLDLAYNIGRHFNVGLKTGGGVVLGNLTADAPDGAQIFKSSPFTLHGMLGAGGHF